MRTVACSSSEVDRFERFAGRYCALELEPFQRLIVTELFASRRELLVLLPRGNGKTTLLASLALFHLLTVERPAVFAAAASRDQASLLFECARRMVEQHPALAKTITPRHRELRVKGGSLRVLAADAPKVHGLTPTLAIVDELHAHRDDELYLALRTAMLKRPGAQLATISTAGVGEQTSPLGRLRSRALALPDVSSDGALTTAHGDQFAMLEWRVPDDQDVDDPHVVKQANPASWITLEGLAEQRQAVQDLAYRRYHCNQWTTSEARWLPPGAWQACAGNATIDPGEEVWIGVDVGGSRAASAIVLVTEDLRVYAETFQGDGAVLDVADRVRDLASDYTVREVAYDPWRFRSEALRLEEERLPVVEFPQSHARMCPASERLYSAVVEQRLTHNDQPDLNAHVNAAIARDTARGWRLDKAKTREQIDAVVALAMALERAENQPAPARLLGFV